MKKIISFLLVLIMSFSVYTEVYAETATKNSAETNNYEIDVEAKSAVLMEANTGRIIYSKNEEQSLSPASVTKIMTLLLTAEALQNGNFSLEDKVSISAYASSMGGSQVFLEEGETITVEELIKCAVIASANDASVALAELVAGNEDAFVNNMNKRAKELGMNNTNFENVTGLDDTTDNHVTSALDIAIMSRELIKHEVILKYSSLWQDTIRNGDFTLTNTNRLVRFYDGCNGLKTGSTSKAGYCMSATAKRDGMQLIAVIMGADTRDKRNEMARALLDYGFANYTLYSKAEKALEPIQVAFGVKDKVVLYEGEFCALVKKSDTNKIEATYTVPEKIKAPVIANEAIGKIEYTLYGEKIGEAIIYSKEAVGKIDFLDVYIRILCAVFRCN